MITKENLKKVLVEINACTEAFIFVEDCRSIQEVIHLAPGDYWCYLLSLRPEFSPFCIWDRLTGEDWSFLLISQPQFAEFCDWGKLDGDDWGHLLAVHPQFAHRCDWGKLTGTYAWIELLFHQPQFVDHCPVLDQFQGLTWALLLITRPDLAKYCDWGKLKQEDWDQLLEQHPQFNDFRTAQ